MSTEVQKTRSAGGVVLNQDGLVLVVSQNGTSWSLPKGHIEEGESELAAAKRETREESGIDDIELVKKLGNYQRYKIGKDGGEDRSDLKTIFISLFRTNQTDLKPIDPQNPEARWVRKEDVADLLTHPKDKEFFLSIVNKI